MDNSNILEWSCGSVDNDGNSAMNPPLSRMLAFKGLMEQGSTKVM